MIFKLVLTSIMICFNIIAFSTFDKFEDNITFVSFIIFINFCVFNAFKTKELIEQKNKNIEG